MIVCACGGANAEERALDDACDRPVTGARPARASPPSAVRIEVGAVEKSESRWSSLAGAMIGAMPPSIVDVTASIGEVLLEVEALGPENVYTAVDVRRVDGGVDVSWSAVNVADALVAAPPPVEKPFRLFNGTGYAIAAAVKP